MTRRRIDHSRQRAMAAVELLYGDAGRYAALSAGDLSVFINSREKLLEQEWEGENNC